MRPLFCAGIHARFCKKDIVTQDTNPALSDFAISSGVLVQAAFVPSGSLLEMQALGILAVQWLGIHAYTEGSMGLTPGWGTEIRMPCGTAKNKKERNTGFQVHPGPPEPYLDYNNAFLTYLETVHVWACFWMLTYILLFTCEPPFQSLCPCLLSSKKWQIIVVHIW